ncbi:MAG: ribonuclease III [Deltaproteobacteria bacterium]|nr:MAG: ribonuclease III [Deltaproteobacteria bacterium]
MQKLQYQFTDRRLIQEACRHSSFVNEQADAVMQDNERLEFLGDAVLNLVVGHILMKRFPELKEGELSRMRASLVNESQLAIIAQMLDLGTYIQLGRGEEQTSGREKNSILANTFEAVVAAVYLDGGFDVAHKFIETHFLSLLEDIQTPAVYYDYKSQLQEYVQAHQRLVPQYRVMDESGPDHDKTFVVQLQVKDLRTEGVGKSKKLAEQDAASKALEILKSDT